MLKLVLESGLESEVKVKWLHVRWQMLFFAPVVTTQGTGLVTHAAQRSEKAFLHVISCFMLPVVRVCGT